MTKPNGWKEEIIRLVDEYATNWEDWGCLGERLLELIAKQRTQAILSAEDNMRKRCVEALPKERNLNTKFPTFGVNRENESWIRGFNVAIDQATQNINNLDKGK